MSRRAGTQRALGRGALLALLGSLLAAAAGHAADAKSTAGGDAAASAQAPEMRDPLRPPGYGAAGGTSAQEKEARFDASAWQLASTLVSRERRAAIINGRNVLEGESVAGATVVDIQSGRVTLDYRGRRFTIRNPTPSLRLRERAGDRSQ